MSENRADEATGAAPLITCPVCGRNVPDGEFCGACGAHLTSGSRRADHRPHAFAADPGEHIFHLSVVSTLFPHLPHRHSTPFRLALLVTAALLLFLGLFRLTGPTVAVAALAVPLLYLIYLYEVEVYEDEPLLVIGATFVLGLLVGIPWAILVGPFITRTLLLDVTVGVVPWRLLLAGIIFPLVAQLLMLAGAIVIYLTRRYDEALDGFTFGVAGALGFTLSTTLINLLPEMKTGLVSNAPIVTSVLDVLERGLLVPFLNASTTGLIAGALWLRRGRVRNVRFGAWTTSLGAAGLIAAVVSVGIGLVNVLAVNTVIVAIAYVVATVALLLWVRVALHHMLLSEAVEVSIGPDLPCFNCHHVVPRMAFCPHCGIATRATPKTGHGRLGRAFR